MPNEARGRGRAARALSVGALALTALTSRAALADTNTTYPGSDCVYETNTSRLSTTYSSSLGTKSTTSLHCPVLRTQPTYKHYYAEVIFGPPAADTTVSCFLSSPNASGGGDAGHEATDTVSKGYGYSLLLSSTLQLGLSESSFWSAMNDDAHAQWRGLSIVCETNGAPVLGYEVTESP